jgi:NAD-dependent deacetylase
MLDKQSLDAKGCADLIRRSERMVGMTGAGISTAADIPDFRGPQGLYVTRRYDPDTVFDISAFRRDPAPFYEFTRDFLGVIDTIEPTFTHRFLAGLEAAGRLSAVVTQNIDSLHQKSGSENVIRLRERHLGPRGLLDQPLPGLCPGVRPLVHGGCGARGRGSPLLLWRRHQA